MVEHTLTMDLTPTGHLSAVLLDGTDISDVLSGLTVDTDINGGTRVTLRCAAGHRVTLTARLPEAQIVISVPAPQGEQP